MNMQYNNLNNLQFFSTISVDLVGAIALSIIFILILIINL